jgi:glycosyltransferase involved in cell wall biosynthesis
MTQLIVIDPGLLELSGHHFNYNASIFRECRSRGIDVSIYAHSACSDDVAEVLPIKRCFDINIYDWQTVNTRKDMENKFKIFNNSVEENLVDKVNVNLGPDDLILILTTTVHQIVGVMKWYSQLKNPKPRICMQFMHHPWYLGLESDPDFCTSILQQAMTSWEDDGSLRVTFAADNDLLANFLNKISGLPIRTLPMPINYPVGSFTGSRSNPERVRFGFLGDGRLEKGLHHFVGAILDQKAENVPNAEFFIHISNQQGRNAYYILKNVPNCTVLCKQFTSVEYWDSAKSCDAIVLPYDPKYYHIRGSGILFEAMGLGKPVIVTAGSCLDWLVAKHGGAGMRCDFTPESLLDAVRFLATNFADFKQIAETAGKHVRQKHNPKAFLDALLME